MAKELFICYDKLCEKPANVLMGLLSHNQEIKASIYRPNKFPTIVSRQHTLYIGQNCTKNLVFDDSFNEYGIRVGTDGTYAWVVCSVFVWNGTKFHNFIAELQRLCNKYNLTKEYKRFEQSLDVFKTQFIHGYEPWEGNFIERSKDPALDRESTLKKSQDIFLSGGTLVGLPNLIGKIGRIIEDQDDGIRVYQYLYAILKFYDQYLGDFMNLTEE